MAILRSWQPGMDVTELKEVVLNDGVIGRATALRVNDIVGRIFNVRYLADGGKSAERMKMLVNLGASERDISQLLFLHAARGHDILRDFVTEIYWGRVMAGSDHITKQDALLWLFVLLFWSLFRSATRHLDFIQVATNMGRIAPPWSESTVARMARYLGTALGDFGLAARDRSGSRDVLPFDVKPLTALYLAHDLHFDGVGDRGVLEHRDWSLFGLSAMDVRRELDRLGAGHLIVQYSADVVTISWKHESMGEAIRAIAATELR